MLGFVQSSMRVAVACLMTGMAWSGGAQASSIITLPAMKGTVGPSMIALGQPASASVAEADPDIVTPPEVAAGGDTSKDGTQVPGEVRISPSIVALGEPEVTSEKVAAIGDDKPTRRNSPPMVIRGGIVGDAFSPVASTPAAEPQSSAEAKEQPQAAGSDGQPAASDKPDTPPPAPMEQPE